MAYKAQTAARITANKKAKAERHAKRLAKQTSAHKLTMKPHGYTRFARRAAGFQVAQESAEA